VSKLNLVVGGVKSRDPISVDELLQLAGTNVVIEGAILAGFCLHFEIYSAPDPSSNIAVLSSTELAFSSYHANITRGI
jgi:hypothetical protein